MFYLSQSHDLYISQFWDVLDVAHALMIGLDTLLIDWQIAKWMSDVGTVKGSVSALCVTLNAWVYNGFDALVLYEASDGTVQNITFLTNSGGQRASGIFEVPLPSNVSTYQVLIYPRLQQNVKLVGPLELGFIKWIEFFEGSCFVESKYLLIIVCIIHVGLLKNEIQYNEQ